MIRCLILEDQAPARRVLESYLSNWPNIEVVGSSAAPSTAKVILSNETVDILILDLGLPQQDGFDFLTTLNQPPVVIVTTAYSARAAEGFTLGVADFLVKPFSLERFRQAIEKASAELRHRNVDQLIAIPTDRGQHEYVASRKIFSLSADGDYVQIHTSEKRFLTAGPLTKWAEKLASPPFIRIHRSHIVNLNHVAKTTPKEMEVGERLLPISATYADKIKALINS